MESAPSWSQEQYARLVPTLDSEANKYTRGTVAVIGGSSMYPGAPILTAKAATRCGAGYVKLIAPEGAAVCARAHLLSVPVTSVAQNESGGLCESSVLDALAAAQGSDVWAVGPGMLREEAQARFVVGLLSQADLSHIRALVLDADALTLLAQYKEAARAFADIAASVPVIITPHEGEAARLLGHPVVDREADALELARDVAGVAVLKGPRTLVASNGGRLVKNLGAGPELATAGSGDVLCGMCAALAAQMDDAFEAAALAVKLHGLAGKHAAGKLSVHSVTPEDIIDSIGSSFKLLGA